MHAETVAKNVEQLAAVLAKPTSLFVLLLLLWQAMTALQLLLLPSTATAPRNNSSRTKKLLSMADSLLLLSVLSHNNIMQHQVSMKPSGAWQQLHFVMTVAH